jgi:hypothetical protein
MRLFIGGYLNGTPVPSDFLEDSYAYPYHESIKYTKYQYYDRRKVTVANDIVECYICRNTPEDLLISYISRFKKELTNTG